VRAALVSMLNLCSTAITSTESEDVQRDARWSRMIGYVLRCVGSIEIPVISSPIHEEIDKDNTKTPISVSVETDVFSSGIQCSEPHAKNEKELKSLNNEKSHQDSDTLIHRGESDETIIISSQCEFSTSDHHKPDSATNISDIQQNESEVKNTNNNDEIPKWFLSSAHVIKQEFTSIRNDLKKIKDACFKQKKYEKDVSQRKNVRSKRPKPCRLLFRHHLGPNFRIYKTNSSHEVINNNSKPSSSSEDTIVLRQLATELLDLKSSFEHLKSIQSTMKTSLFEELEANLRSNMYIIENSKEESVRQNILSIKGSIQKILDDHLPNVQPYRDLVESLRSSASVHHIPPDKTQLLKLKLTTEALEEASFRMNEAVKIELNPNWKRYVIYNIAISFSKIDTVYGNPS
jgi:hypothetical protein